VRERGKKALSQPEKEPKGERYSERKLDSQEERGLLGKSETLVGKG